MNDKINYSDYVEVKPRRLVQVRFPEEVEKLRSFVNQGEIIESVEVCGTLNGKPLGYLVSTLKLEPYEKEVWGESFDDYAKRTFPAVYNKKEAYDE